MAPTPFQSTQAVHWLDSFDEPRGLRDVHDYVARILEGLVKNIAMLRADASTDCCTSKESQRIGHELFDPVRDQIDQGEITGESLERDAIARVDAGAIHIEDRARIAYAYCHEAEVAYNRNNLTVAWTFVVDAMRVAADVGTPVAFRAGATYGFSSRGKQGELVSRNHPRRRALIEAKAQAHALWRERRAGKYPKLRRNLDFAGECVKRWPALNISTITQKWCPQWEREARKKNQPR